MSTVIFLDVDGVLLSVSPISFGGGDLDHSCLMHFKTIVASVPLTVHIVLSSTWRNDPTKISRLEGALQKSGIVPYKIHSGVPNGVPVPSLVTYFKRDPVEQKLVRDRVDEIHQWIIDHQVDVPAAAAGRWFAIDDMNLGVDQRMNGHFVKTDVEEGLQKSDVARAGEVIQGLPVFVPVLVNQPIVVIETVAPEKSLLGKEEFGKEFRLVRHKSQENTEHDSNVFEINSQRRPGAVTATIVTILQRDAAESVTLWGVGRAVAQVVCVAEAVKRTVQGLHQVTRLSSRNVMVTLEHRETKEQRSVERSLPALEITLSTNLVDGGAVGYQPPQDAVPRTADAVPRRQRRRGDRTVEKEGTQTPLKKEGTQIPLDSNRAGRGSRNNRRYGRRSRAQLEQ